MAVSLPVFGLIFVALCVGILLRNRSERDDDAERSKQFSARSASSAPRQGIDLDFGRGGSTRSGSGTTPLTKRVEKGFILTTRLTSSDIWGAINATCASHPPKTKTLLTVEKHLQTWSVSGNKRVVGLAGKGSSGAPAVPSWSLGLSGSSPLYQLVPNAMKLRDGGIEDVKEIEFFLNALQRELQAKDPRATIAFSA